MESKTAFKGHGKLQQHWVIDKTKGYSTTNLEQNINPCMVYFKNYFM